jgi:hypothetical protein
MGMYTDTVMMAMVIITPVNTSLDISLLMVCGTSMFSKYQFRSYLKNKILVPRKKRGIYDKIKAAECFNPPRKHSGINIHAVVF